MIILALLNVLKLILSVFTVWFEPVSELPWGLDAYFVTGFSGFYSLAEIFPPLGIVIQAFVIYVLFKLSLLIFKMIPVIGKAYH